MDSGSEGLLIENAFLGDQHLPPPLRKRPFFGEFAREAQENPVMPALRDVKTVIKARQFNIF